jgi:hypothetical protein
METVGSEPLIGWRLWRAVGDTLVSWIADETWTPGENMAHCLTQYRVPCSVPPGAGCQCGFWATFGPDRCLQLVRPWIGERALGLYGRPVIGLVAGWGEVRLHGREGFRAERAAPVLLFSDVVRPRGLRPLRGWHRRRANTLERLRAHYGVPVVSLEAALHRGVLAELGVQEPGVAQAARMLGRQPREYPPGLKGGEPGPRTIS